jgi:peptidoglycan/LPS O-acetylase OafA/YrhL
VQLFFVLSGFLITGILLDYRQACERNTDLTAGAALRTFYVRRFLRIFPLYYGVIAATALLNIGPIRELWPWHVCYTSNFLYGIHAPLPGDPFTHFWSLGVEEQFYLLWPFLIFFLPLERLKWLILILIVSAPAFRIAMHSAFPEFNRVNYFPVSCCDSLGIGAGLACAWRKKAFRASAAAIANRIALVGIGGGMAVAGLIAWRGSNFSLQTIGHTCLVLVFGWLVFGAAQGFSGWFGAFLNRPELRYLGKISYGLYVYHNFFTRVSFAGFFATLGLPATWSNSILLNSFVRLICTIFLASASWSLFEHPFNSLKRYFTLSRGAAVSAGFSNVEPAVQRVRVS